MVSEVQQSMNPFMFFQTCFRIQRELFSQEKATDDVSEFTLN